jgi:hypothetical protein
MIRSRPAAQGPNDGRLESAHSATYPGARTFECPRFRTPLRHDPRIARRRNRASVEIPYVGCASRMFIKTMRTQSFGGGFRSGLSCADIGNLKRHIQARFRGKIPKKRAIPGDNSSMGNTPGSPESERSGLGTHDKALKINLDPLRYGTFAEIGAGQEVARWFHFRL